MIKYIRLASDVHLDKDIALWASHKREVQLGGLLLESEMDLLWYPEPLDTDLETCFIIAGDLWEDRRILTRIHPFTKKSWLEMIAERFKYVIFVLGNHDYWYKSITTEVDSIRRVMKERGMTNTFLLEHDTIILDQVKFVGGTLWTDFNKSNPLVMLDAPTTMNDYNYIKEGTSYKKVQPNTLLDIFNKTKDHIFNNGKKDYPEQRVFALTHMAPSFESIDEVYKQATDNTNYYYYSELSNEIYYNDHDIELWFHGHCHSVSDYLINTTRVICNPRGYGEWDQTNWNPKWIYKL